VNSLTTSGPIWYLMRGSGIVSLLLLTIVVALGVATTNRWGTRRTPRFVTTALHRNAALLATLFLLLHVVTAVIDPEAGVRLISVVVPFLATRSPLGVGLGALALDVLLALVATSLIRSRLPFRAWRAVHWSAYACWPLALVHGIATGTDSGTVWLLSVNLACIAVVGAALSWRVTQIDDGPKRLEVAR
jgi:sulfoxide reductase heme-binding subunit YedZ